MNNHDTMYIHRLDWFAYNIVHCKAYYQFLNLHWQFVRIKDFENYIDNIDLLESTKLKKKNDNFFVFHLVFSLFITHSNENQEENRSKVFEWSTSFLTNVKLFDSSSDLNSCDRFFFSSAFFIDRFQYLFTTKKFELEFNDNTVF